MSRPSPYVGPRAIGAGERLYGREREVARLFDLLLASRIVLLYSPSGAGKSSLLNAGLIPRLREEGFHVRPTVRVGIEPPRGVDGNRHVLSALLSLEGDVPKDSELPAGQSLAGYLDRRRADDGLDDDAPEVLLFDQFEEILTVDPTAIAAKQAFFAALGEALRDERRWAVVAMREDFIAGLDPYRAALPTALGTTFRLDLLGPEAALAAIRGPARDAGVEFRADAADKLVNDLRQVRVQRFDGAVETQLGPHVEPVQLQVVCLELWNRLGAEEKAIGREHLARLGEVDAALATYYDAQVEAAARRGSMPERVLRQWIGRHLVTANGLRSQVLQTPEATLGLANAALAALVDAHLLRTDTRRGMTWLELAHDRIVRPVQDSNARWFSAKLSAVQRQAELWDSQGRPEALLLATAAEAEKLLAAGEERSRVEREFLEHGARVRRREEAARRNLKLLRALSAAVGLMVLAGLVIGIVTVIEAGEQALEEAQKREQEAKARERAAQARAEAADAELTRQLVAQVALHREQQPELAALLGVAASRRLDDSWQRRAALINAEVTAPHLVTRLTPGTAGSQPWKVIAGDGGLIAIDRAGQVWAMTLDGGATPLLPADVKAVDVAARPGSRLLAIGRAGGTVTLWDRDAGEVGSIALAGDEDANDDRAWAEGLQFAADGRSLLAVRRESQQMWLGFVIDVETRTAQELGPLTPPMYASPSDMALAADGAIAVLALETADGALAAYSGQPFKRSARRARCEESCPMLVARFSPTGTRLLSGGEGALALWDVAGGTIAEAPRVVVQPIGGTVRDMLYMRDGRVAVLTEATISLWDAETLAPSGTPIELPAGDASGLAEAGPRGELLAVAFAADAPLHVFDPRRLAPRGIAGVRETVIQGARKVPFEHSRVLAALRPGGSTVAVGEFDGATKRARVTLIDVAGTSPDVVLAPLAGEQLTALEFVDGRPIAADVEGTISRWDGAQWSELGMVTVEDEALALGGEGSRVVVAASDGEGAYLAREADRFAARTRFGAPKAVVHAIDGAAQHVAVSTCAAETRPRACSRSHVDVHVIAAPAPSRRLIAEFAVDHVVFGGGGQRIAASGGRQLRAWNLSDGAPIELTVRRDLGQIAGLALSDDGRILAATAATEAAAKDVVLWDLSTGEELAPPLRAHNPAIGGTEEGTLLLAGDGGLVVSAACDGVVLWPIDEAALRGRACALARRELTPAEQARFLGTRRPYEALCAEK